MFERFTDRARRVLVFAQEEATRLGHDHVGTEHLLLGLVHEGEGVAAKALESIGISLEGVREQVEELVESAGQGETAVVGHIPFTPRAKKVLELSLREALQLGHQYIGTEHVLLGLVREGECVAAQVLQRLGADLSRVRAQVIRMLSGYAGAEPAEPPQPAESAGGRRAWQEVGWALLASGSETTWRALGLARQEAALGSHPAVEVSDLVIGVLRTGDTQVMDALAAAGATAASPADVAPARPHDDEPPPLALSPQVRDACGEALRLAGAGTEVLRPAHLLLGCLHVLDREGTEAVAARLGVEAARLMEHLGRPVVGGGP